MRRKRFLLGMVVVLAIAFCSGSVLAEDVIKVGVPYPATGGHASDGQSMYRAIEMAVDEYNAQGGLLGRQLEIISGDVGDLRPENVISVAERLRAAKCDVILTGYCSGTNAAVKTFGQDEVPFLTGIAYHVTSDAIEEGLPGTNNCFEYVWDEFTYGKALENEMFEMPKKMGWTPPNKKVAVIKIDVGFSIDPADYFIAAAKRMGYEVVIDETVGFDKVDFGTFLTKLEREKPSYIFVTLLLPENAARFQMQFHDRFSKKGLNAILAHQWTPAATEWLDLVGNEVAEGVIFMAGAVRENEPRTRDYMNRWEAKYNERPRDLYVTCTRDGFEIWAQAVKRAGSVDDYTTVNRLIRESVYEGLWGNYVFSPRDQTALYGEYLLPLEWMQYGNNGKYALVAPDKSKVADYQKPPWIKD